MERRWEWPHLNVAKQMLCVPAHGRHHRRLLQLQTHLAPLSLHLPRDNGSMH